MTAKYSAIIPLAHKECKLLPNVPLLLDETIAVRSIRSEHIGAIISKRRSLSEALNSKTKCILIQTGDQEANKLLVETTALCGTFVLNMFAKTGASLLDQAFIIKFVRSYIRRSRILYLFVWRLTSILRLRSSCFVT